MSSVKMCSALTFFTFLLLSFFSLGLAQNPGSATNISDSYPPFWDKISGDIAEFPVKDKKIIIDVWNYIDRLKMYKILITRTSKYFVQFGPNNSGNVLWALTLFFGKLYQTDRFSDPSTISECAYDARSPGCISINSAWGGINFYVIGIYFLSAIESGFLKDVPHKIVLLPRKEHRSDFCYSIQECKALHPQAMEAAGRFYQYLQSRMTLSTVSHIYNTDEDMATVLMWDASQAAIDIGLAKFSDRSKYSSEMEKVFTKDFLVYIEFCGTARYRSGFNSSEEFLVGYPHRLLTNQDDPVLTSDLSIRERALWSAVKFFSKVNEATGGLLLTTWKNAMSLSELFRDLGRFIIKRLLLLPTLY